MESMQLFNYVNQTAVWGMKLGSIMYEHSALGHAIQWIILNPNERMDAEVSMTKNKLRNTEGIDLQSSTAA
jgi:hypothetical protein